MYFHSGSESKTFEDHYYKPTDGTVCVSSDTSHVTILTPDLRFVGLALTPIVGTRGLLEPTTFPLHLMPTAPKRSPVREYGHWGRI